MRMDLILTNNNTEAMDGMGFEFIDSLLVPIGVVKKSRQPCMAGRSR